MTFGKIIKDLRQNNNLTQEKLAELLNISPQAVSRWETGAAMPDISLLPPLSNLFSVTTDYLLGMETYQKDLRKAEFDKAFFEYWKKDNKEKNYQIAIQAVAEYPGNMEYVEWLASAEFYVAFQWLEQSDEEFHRLLDSAIKHYKIVLDSHPPQSLHDKALNGIVLSYHWKGDLESAKEYALTEEDAEKRDDLLLWCLEGEEKLTHCQTLAEKKLRAFILSLQLGCKTLAVCDGIEQVLYSLFPDGNFQFHHNLLTYNFIDKAFFLCGDQRYDEAVTALTKARYHAEQDTLFSKQDHYRYTAPLFHLVSGDKPVSDSADTPLDAYRVSLNRADFDSLRHREDFQSLLK
ncbi:MAG: helix-turn-helix transcriptional regulator [Clostridia bacterium]|nr:helix-turn-helix transcriptional regulator [Clostridia bacterium]